MSGFIFFLLSMERRIFDFFALRIYVNAVTPFKKRKKQWPILLFSILLLGTINFLEEEGNDLKVDINFDKVGHKRLMAKYAGLEVIE